MLSIAILSLTVLQSFYVVCEGSVLRFDRSGVGAGGEPSHRQLVDSVPLPVELESASQCGYESCDLGKEGYINVHMVPHTHDDVGWLSSVDVYYVGHVQYILDTVINALQRDSSRRFIYVEQAYFSRWWNEQDDTMRHLVKGLVNAGQLEFILGGWSMNDEATTHYTAVIDQHTAGFHFLKKNFGDCGRPRIGWQIDPFGHSRETASLFAQFGFDGLFFARLDNQDWSNRLASKSLELVWRGSTSLGDQASLFTGITFGRYTEPDGFCFECGSAPVVDDQYLSEYNAESRVNSFVTTVQNQAKYYQTNHIMLTMGGDFQYANAEVNFKNIDRLIKDTNARQANGSRINVLYSTPSCYLYALNKANITYTHKEDDFFPYAHADHFFWTGFYTSRPALKRYARMANNFYQVCRQLDSLSLLGPEHGSSIKIQRLADGLGIVQHHDGISGTEQQHVADDYARRLAMGISECQDVVNNAYRKLLPRSTAVEVPDFEFCNLLNVSYCATTEKNDRVAVILYNPFAHDVMSWTRIPVVGQGYTVTDDQLRTVDSQLIPLSPETMKLPDRKGSISNGELLFLAEIPASGFSTYFVLKSADDENAVVIEKQHVIGATELDLDFSIKNEFLSVDFDGSTGLIKGITNLAKSISIDVGQNLYYYVSNAGGAYMFRPVDPTVHPVSGGSPVKTSVFQGSQVQEVRQVFSDWASQVVRLYSGTQHLEIEWTVGPIPVGTSKEVISRFTTPLNTNGTYYTDANGRETMQRIRNHRSFPFVQTEPVAGNYYPVTSRIFVQDVTKDIQLTVLTDRSQGGGSIYDGELELMLHRRLFQDEGFGVDEALNERGIDGKGLVVRGKHYVYLDNIASSARLHRALAQQLFFSPSLVFTPLTSTPQDYVKNFNTRWSGLKGRLPDNVNLLTLEQWDASTLLVRLEHFYASDEDPQLSQPAIVQLKDLFTPFTIDSVQELTLAANQPLETATRLQWTVHDYGQTTRDMKSFFVPVDPTSLLVTIKPMQIRTFQISLSST